MPVPKRIYLNTTTLLADAASLPPRAFGLYWLTLLQCWQHPEGIIPSVSWLRERVGGSNPTLRRVLDEWFYPLNGRWTPRHGRAWQHVQWRRHPGHRGK